MLQSVATLLSLLIATGTVALIAATLTDEWRTILRAVRNGGELGLLPLPAQGRATAHVQRARIVRVRSQSAPQRAAA